MKVLTPGGFTRLVIRSDAPGEDAWGVERQGWKPRRMKVAKGQSGRRKPYTWRGEMCVYCGIRKCNRSRGLCWTCYYAPGVRDKVPSTSKYAHRGTGNFSGAAPLPPVPTTAPPGTAEKLLVLEQRAKASRQLFHPADARLEGDPRPLEFMGQQQAA